MSWNGRISYLEAKEERRKVEIYAMDLLWAVAKSKLVDPRKPSEIWYGTEEDGRSAEEIIDDVLGKLGGE